MPITATQRRLERLHQAIYPLAGDKSDYDPLLQSIGDATYVLLGEATHGTHEFYAARAAISQRLIQDKGFSVITWEADWPDASAPNRTLESLPVRPHG